ncbi:MAG: hypothetical protein ACREJ2_06390 [Planctomycetota bacterium]
MASVDQPLILLASGVASLESMNSLARGLVERGVPAANLRVVHLDPTRDEIDLLDLVRLLDKTIKAEHLVDESGRQHEDGPFSVIAHGVAGLILNHWIELFYPDGLVPIRTAINIATPLMGSRAASARQRLSDRAADFGLSILQDIELGSTLQYDSALRYCKNKWRETPPFFFALASEFTDEHPERADKVEFGTDGFTRVTSANPNVMRINRKNVIDITAETPFHVFKGFPHSGASGLLTRFQEAIPADDPVLKRIMEFLSVRDEAAYRTQMVRDSWREHPAIQVVVHPRDQYGRLVSGCYAEFYVDGKRDNSILLHSRAEGPTNHLTFLLDARGLVDGSLKTLTIQVTHRPEGWLHFGAGAQAVLFDADNSVRAVQPGCTTLVDMMLVRTFRHLKADISSPEQK